MSGLLIRADQGEAVLRSVGGPPNGIVTLAYPEGRAAWTIDPNFEPPQLPQGQGVVVVAAEVDGGINEASTVIEPDALVEACVDQLAGFVVWQFTQTGVIHAAQTFAPGGEFEAMRTTVEWAAATRDALEARGWFSEAA